MSENAAVCRFCGSATETSSQFCHNCGASLNVTGNANSDSNVKIISESPIAPAEKAYSTDSYATGSTGFAQKAQDYRQGSTPYPQQTTTYRPQSRNDDSNGTVALIFGILACVGILPCIGSIIAIAMGGNSNSSNGRTGRTLGIISLIFNILGFGLLFLFM